MCHLVIDSFTPRILGSRYVQGTMLELMLTWPTNGTKSLPSVNLQLGGGLTSHKSGPRILVNILLK